MTQWITAREYLVTIPIEKSTLNGSLVIPDNAKGIVLFAHGSGSSRFSLRNQHVATVLNQSQLATLLFDLLTEEEETIDNATLEFRFDIPFLAERLIQATLWVKKQSYTQNLSIGYFGASTGGGAALIAAAKKPNLVRAIVSRGGRPDLAEKFLTQVKTPTLLIVGENDTPVIKMNESALSQLTCIKKLDIVPGATHLFEEAGTLDTVAGLAQEWFSKYF